jgi:hypothetical protein
MVVDPSVVFNIFVGNNVFGVFELRGADGGK